MRSTQVDRDGTRTIIGVFAGTTGLLTSGTGIVITKQGPGAWMLRFPALRSLIHAVVNAHAGAGGYTATCSLQTDGSLQVWGWSGATLTDMPIGVSVTGLPSLRT